MQLIYVISQLCVSHHEIVLLTNNIETAHLWKLSGLDSMSTTNISYSHRNIGIPDCKSLLRQGRCSLHTCIKRKSIGIRGFNCTAY